LAQLLQQSIHFRYFQELKTSSNNPFYEIRNAMAHNPLIVVGSEEEALESIANGNKLLIMQDDERILFKAQHYCDYIFM
jgi:hypothetical protein